LASTALTASSAASRSHHAAGQPVALLDPENAASSVWAEPTYHCKANLRQLDRRTVIL